MQRSGDRTFWAERILSAGHELSVPGWSGNSGTVPESYRRWGQRERHSLGLIDPCRSWYGLCLLCIMGWCWKVWSDSIWFLFYKDPSSCCVKVRLLPVGGWWGGHCRNAGETWWWLGQGGAGRGEESECSCLGFGKMPYPAWEVKVLQQA